MTVQVLTGDCLEVLRTLPDESVHCCVTSPPYWGLRDYGVAGQIGLEASPDEFVEKIVDVFREVRRVLRDDGTLWMNMGDSYATGTTSDRGPTATGKHGYWENPAVNKRIDGRSFGLKPKDLIGQPWMLAFALRADGWWLRQDIIWHKPNPMPESIKDRCTKAHEYVFLLSKSERYYYDQAAISELAGDDPAGIGGWATGDDHTAAGFAKESAPPSHGDLNKRAARRQKMPDGWDTGTGGHGSFHRQGREKGKYSFAREVAESPPPGAQPQHRPDREDVAYVGRRNKRSVWTVATHAFPDAHFATFPPDLIEPCIKAGCPPGGTVLDPFGGAGTTGLVADRLQRNAILIELNPSYADMARARITGDAPLFADVQ